MADRNATMSGSSTRPYLIRALHEWCTDNGFTPYIVVRVDEGVQVPFEFVKDGEIVLNASIDATSALRLGNDFIEFKARFSGTPREVIVPVGRVMAIYARENGQGMAFPAEEVETGGPTQPGPAAMRPEGVPKDEAGEPAPPKPAGPGKATRPNLKRVK